MFKYLLMCKYKKISCYANLYTQQINRSFLYLVKKDLIYSLSMAMALKSISTGDVHVLGSNNTYFIGRSRRNHIQLKDSSVGAQHASLQIKNGIAYIQDASSKHGTQVNDISIKTCVKLKHKDTITFGKNNCSYAFIETPINVHIEQDTYSLTSALRNLKLHYTRDYSKSNNYYVTSFVSQEMMRSTSILHYLIARKYVVTPKYFTDLDRDINEAPTLPNIYRYMPEIDVYLKNKGVVDINPQAKRNTLFNNALFIFFDEQDYESITVFIEKCCGEALLYKEDPEFMNMLLKEWRSCHYVVVDTQESSEMANNCVLILKAAKRDVQKMSNDDICLNILKAEFNCPCTTDKSGKSALAASVGKPAQKNCNNLSEARSHNTERNVKRKELKKTSKPGNNMGSNQTTPVALERHSRNKLPNWLLKAHSSSNNPDPGTPGSTNKGRKTCTQKEFSKELDSPSRLLSESTERTSSSCVENWFSEVLSASDRSQSEVTNSAQKACTQKDTSNEQMFPSLLPPESPTLASRSCVENWLSKVQSSSNRSPSNQPEVTNSAHKCDTQEEFSKERNSPSVLSSKSTERTNSFCVENWLLEVLSSSHGLRPELTNSARKACSLKEFSREWDLPNQLPSQSTERTSRSCVENWLSKILSSSNGPRSNQPEVTNSAQKGGTQKEFSKEKDSSCLLSSESIERTSSFCVENWLSEVLNSSNGARPEFVNLGGKTCTQKELSNEWDLPSQLPPESTERAGRSCIEHRPSKVPSSSNGSRPELPPSTNSDPKVCTCSEFSEEQNSLSPLRSESIIRVANSCVDRGLSNMQISNEPHRELTNQSKDIYVRKGLLKAQRCLNLSGSQPIEAENVAGSPHKDIESEKQKSENIPSVAKKRRVSFKESSGGMVSVEKLKRKYKGINILDIS